MMKAVGKSLLCAWHNFRKWPTSARMLSLVLLLWLALDTNVGELAEYARLQQQAVGFWGVYPLLSSGMMSKLLINMGALILFCDAPFVDAVQPYLVLRSGRWPWAVGQLIYMALATAAYLLVINVISGLYLWGQLTLTNQWGECLQSMAYMTKMTGSPISFTAEPNIVLYYTPLKAWGMSMALDFMGVFLMGSVTFLANRATGGSKGVVAAGVLMASDTLVEYAASSPKWFFFSPMTLTRLAQLDLGYIPTKPDVWYAFVLLPALVAVMAAAMLWAGRYMRIEVREDIG